MKVQTIWFGLLIGCSLFAFADSPKDFDVLKLNNGSVLDGVLLSEDGGYVQMECTGGTVRLPQSRIQHIVRAAPGESRLLLGKHLLQRKQYTRAERWLTQAQSYGTWKSESTRLLQEVEHQKKKLAEEKKDKEKEKIEQLIHEKGIEAGIAALRKQHNQSDEAQYWGSMRGKLHILMALENLDHLRLKEAERHLTLANQYGVEAAEWNRVKTKLSEMKRMSALHGRDYLLSRFQKPEPKKPSTTTSPSDDFWTKITQAQQEGINVPPIRLLGLVDRYAKQNELDPLLVWALIDVESSWRVKVVSNKGAQGLMQLMPGTAGDLNVSDPFDPEENIRGGTQYMRFLLRMFNDIDTALAAYNVGPGRVERSKTIPQAGVRYVNKVKTRYAALQKQFG